MRQFDQILDRLGFALVLALVLAAPWLFGAWEMWWFWPFTTLLFTAVGLFGLRLLISPLSGAAPLVLTRPRILLLLAYLPFLLYALVRAVQAEVVMDAERSFLLHLTAFLVGALIVCAWSDWQREYLAALTVLNLFLLGVYGIANHFLTHNAWVLWMPGFPGYQHRYYRATGSYFCPDHFAGLMEIGLGLALGLLFARRTQARVRWAVLPLIGVALTGVLLTKSRGGGLVVLGILGLACWWGVAARPPRQRWGVRLAGVAALVLVIAGVFTFGGRYVERFRQYPWRQLEASDRYQMAAAALRAWRTAPVWGIGPGMHQNLWPHFAASADGDPARGRRPTYLNNTFHSYEVHNDWVQLLEEYGAVGFLLFLVAAGAVTGLLARGWSGSRDDGAMLGALLAVAAMAAHSLVDFNLQIPATVWLFAAVMALPVARLTAPSSGAAA